ncbi:response regulator [Rhizobium sp. NFR12]|jgi:two-component system phosphate regulon response regulator OmpR|uniref:response regulator n=1 Tax=Rhizobium sp. NFR12 TaxID=1566261 RepID=UPI0008A78F4C|nr:response regulator [Rhizobium sp. NFR12]SEH26461.1 two-component system, OmpR family, phosphate regulon response regulator OmpR [Rhizobium sp. NFR12]
MARQNPATAHILIVDDDVRITQMLKRYLNEEGYLTSEAKDGEEMRLQLAHTQVDLILLDVSLPGGADGFDLVREVRAASDTPIIMLTGRNDVVDRIIGLEMGADDYLAKPFNLRELHARLKAILRRRNVQPSEQEETDKIVHFDRWALNLTRRELSSADGEGIHLTTGEYDLLAAFVAHPGRVLSRDFLLEETKGRHLDAYDRAIDAQIVRIRRKVEVDPKQPQIIRSIRGVGYMFAARVSVAKVA